MQHDQAVLARVFVNQPDAGLKTPAAAPHYLGNLSFRHEAGPSQHTHAEKPYNVQFELSPELRLELAKQPNLKVTLVPVPVDGALPPTGVLSFAQVYAQEDTSD